MTGRQVALYARISRDRVGAGLGVERQRDDCRALAEQLGWTIVVEHTDNDLSAYSGKPRPGYRALLEDLREGRADAVIAWHTDRLHRSPSELEDYISVCEARGVPTHCVKAGPLDLTTPSGRLVARQLGAVARYEVEHAIERQRRSKAQAAADGRFRGGRRAFGYEADGVTVRDDEAAVVEWMTRAVLDGRSVRSVADELNRGGLTGSRGGAWTGASVRDVILRARNAGLIEHDGEIVGPASWPAVVDEQTWRQARATLSDPARRRHKGMNRRWLGSGLYRCGVCGQPVRIGSGGQTRSSMRPFYRCSGHNMHVSRVADRVDELVTGVLVARLSLPDAADLFTTPPVAGPDHLAEAERARLRLDELARAYADGQVTLRQLTTASEPLRAQLASVEQRIAEATRGTALDGLATAPDVAVWFADLALDRRRAIVAELVDVTILVGRRGRKPGGYYFDPESVRIEWKATS